VFWEAIQQWLVGTRLVRRLTDTLFRGRARRHVAALDHLDGTRSQLRILRGLVHLGHATRFGRDHDFRRIRTAADFRRLVPLRTPADFWRDYWEPIFPDLAGATWPGPIPSLIATPTASTPYVPASPALWAGHRAAALSALSFVAATRPEARLFSGRMLLVGDGPPPTLLGNGIQSGSFEALGLLGLPPRLRPYAHVPAPCGEPTCPPESRLRTLAEQSLRLPVTCVAGGGEVLDRFLALCRRESGWSRGADVWPGLTAVVYGNAPGAGPRCGLAEQLGVPERRQPPLLLEACVRAEGVVAVEDPRYGCLRLLVDHGVYFEFVPTAELGSPQPARHGLADVVPGIPYAVALTSAAGVWACLAGVRVCFESRDPPLLRVLEAPSPLAPVLGGEGSGVRGWNSRQKAPSPPTPLPGVPGRGEAAPLTLPGPHRRNGDSPAALRERTDHSPWSALADRE
jgi:hypothetical protein